MDFQSLSAALFDKISNAREALSLPPLLSVVEDDSLMQTVYYVEVSTECEVQDADAETSSADALAKFDELIANADSEFSKVLLNSRVTHAHVNLQQNEGIVKIIVRVYYHYCELDPVGEIIDGSLVVQGVSIRDNYGPAFCTLEYAPSMGDDFTEIGVIAPWSFMLTASEGDAASGDAAHKAAQFVIPVSVESEHQSGVIRLLIYVDTVDVIPYDEEPSDPAAYDMLSSERRNSAICASSVIKLATGSTTAGVPTDSEAVQDGERSPAFTGAAEGGDGSARASRRGSERSNASGRAIPVEGVAKGEEGEGGVERAKTEEDDPEVAAILETSDAGETDTKAPQGVGRSLASSGFEADARILEQTQGVIVDIKIASDYDDVLALQSEGYELHCTAVTQDGPISDQEHLWKFHVMAAYGDGSSKTGLEDVAWIKCLKSLGTLPIVPLFQILHDYDLSNEDDDYAIYLAYKIGPNPQFKRLVMLSSSVEEEKFLTNYINAFTAVFRPAPAQISKAVGGPSGIFLMVDANPVREEPKSRKASTRDSPKMRSSGTPGGDARVSSPGASDDGSRIVESDVEEESEDDDYGDEEEQQAAMLVRIEELQAEKAGLVALNSELQKKAVALIAREKAMQGQTAAARTAAEVVATMAAENPDAVLEQNIEKEKQYQDTLQLIVEERVKLNKQLKEFDQLALDLQTRLDDKELKVNGIQSSFKQFKKEILSKAENSRTGQAITAKQIAHFETSEQKHEEDLERVRLRNISLRTTYRKLERTLRAREQLAEGLHMIDFEQLKIENQTLNEKIEERNEDLAKLKRKKTTTVQVLTHIREKLRFVEQANENLAEKLAHLENATTDLRNIVTSDKLYRDDLRAENKELRAKQGFATSDLLLVDYEARCAKVEQLKAATTELKDRYGILVRQVNKGLKSSTSTPWVASSANTLK